MGPCRQSLADELASRRKRRNLGFLDAVERRAHDATPEEASASLNAAPKDAASPQFRVTVECGRR
jgi:hypothetical protein